MRKADSDGAPKKSGQGAVDASIVLLVIVYGVAMIPLLKPLLMYVTLPLFLVTFVLSIVALANGRLAAGLIALLGSTVVPAILIGAAYAERDTTADVAAEIPHEQTAEAPVAPPSTPTPTPATPPPARNARLSQSIGVQTDYGQLEIRAGTPVKIVSDTAKGITVDVSGQRITVERESLSFDQ